MDTAKQMQMAFMMEEGGLTDDGTNMDPVSGNEVPPGSMAEEVRDDIPAQLSEGEYVVPADVVRFYGVKFFEDLRSEAKRGLMDMEANGRIGGEPVAMTIDNQTGGELTPEELAALEQITGMAMGGDVQPANPYLQQQQMYNQPGYNKGGQVLYAQDGTDVSQIDPYTAQFPASAASSFAPGFLIDQTKPPAPRTVVMYGPDGVVETLSLPMQQARYNELLELGYSETPIQTTTETTVGQPARDDGGDATPTPPVKQFNAEDIPVDRLEQTAKGLSTMNKIATAIASSAGLPVAALVNTAGVANYNDIIDRMDAEGIEHDLERQGSIFGGESGLYENLKDLDGDGKRSFGDTWLGDLLGFDGEAGIAEGNPGLRDSFGGARRTGGGDDDDTPVVTPSSNNDSDSTPTPTAVERAAASEDIGATASSTDLGAGVSPTGDDEGYGTPFNHGGMVKRRKNKKKNK